MELGIGARITAVFGLGALILSILMGGLSYFTVRHFLLAGRESADQHQAFTNANLVRTSLETGTTGYVVLLSNIDAGTDAHSVLFHRSKTYDSSLTVTAASIPHELRKVVLSGTAATQTYRTPQGTAEIVIGVPIPSVHAYYFDVFDLSDLDHTLRVLALALFVAGGITTMFGVALGRFASTRSLRPLAVVSRAAGAIAAGDLEHAARRRGGGPRPRRLHPLVQRHGRPAPGADRARGALQLRREPRAALAPHDPGRRHGGARGRPGRAAPRSQRALQLLSDDLRRFQRMVGDLLEMSRAEAGSVDIFLEEVHVAELVRRSVETGFGHMVSARGQGGPPEVEVDPAVRTWLVGVDKRRFERVMVNLMENADHYGGGVTGIQVRPAAGTNNSNGNRHGDQVEVIVDDEGPGIDPLERTKVFERFYRGSASGRRGTGTGTGLGLALVAEHMHVMRGDVRVESSPAGGARFVLTLPVLPDEDHADGEE